MDDSASDVTDVVRRAPFGSNPQVGERGADTQRRILAAALEVFGEVGFNDARVELITEKAGCSRPAFYQYFSSKDDVFWTLAGQLGTDMVALATELGPITPDSAGLDALRAWIGRFMDLHEANAPVFASFQAAQRGHEPTARRSSGISDRTGDALLRAFGVRRSARSATLVTGLVAMLIRCSFYAEVMAGSSEREPLVDGFARMVHRLFAGPIEGVNVIRTGRTPTASPSADPPVPPGSDDGDTPPRQRGARTRDRLLRAGAQVLPSRGYSDTRVDDIVEAAAVSHGTFYRYFENKDDFFKTLAQSAATEMIALLDALRIGAPPPELRSWLQAWFAAYEGNGGVISTWQEMQTDEELATFSRDVAAAVLDRLMVALSQRDFGDTTIDAVLLLALVERLPYSVYTLRFTDQASAIEAMITIIRGGFLGVAEAG